MAVYVSRMAALSTSPTTAAECLSGTVLPVLTARQAAFIEYYLETANATEAWRRAYDKPDAKSATARRCAVDVLYHPKVRAHLAAIPAHVMSRAVITVDFLTGEALENARAAREAGQYAAATGALQLVARLHGLLIDKRELSGHVTQSVQVSGEVSSRSIIDKARDQGRVIDIPPAPLPEPTHDAVTT